MMNDDEKGNDLDKNMMNRRLFIMMTSPLMEYAGKVSPSHGYQVACQDGVHFRCMTFGDGFLFAEALKNLGDPDEFVIVIDCLPSNLRFIIPSRHGDTPFEPIPYDRHLQRTITMAIPETSYQDLFDILGLPSQTSAPTVDP